MGEIEEFAGSGVAKRDQYQRTAMEDLASRWTDRFKEPKPDEPVQIAAGSDSIYPGPSERVPNQDLVRVPIMWDHYVWHGRRTATTALGTSADREPNPRVPHATSLGCDYLLNVEGEIVVAPEINDVQRRYDAIINAHSNVLADYDDPQEDSS